MVTLIVLMIVLGLFSGYIITSFVLLKFPRLIHKKKLLSFKAVHISHRGGAGENIENTIEAFKHAVSVGTDMLELDCHLTKDGQVVVCHDDFLKRLSGFNITIKDTNYEDLPFIKNTQQLDFHHAHITKMDFDEHKIPQLEEIFKNFPQTAINIDVKVDNDELVQKISDLIKQYDRERMTVWGSRFNNVCHKCYKINKNIPLFFSLKRVAILLLFFYSGLLPFVPLKESCFEICMPSILLEKNKFDHFMNKKLKLFVRFLDFILMNRHLFKHLEERGIQVYLWVLNNEGEFNRAMDYKATGIMTDFPTLLRQFLDRQVPIQNTGTELENLQS